MSFRKVFFQTAIVIMIFFFLGKYFLKNYYELSQYQLSINYRYLLIPILCFSGTAFLQPFIWKRILYFLKANLSYKDALEIYSFSSLTRFIPGRIWPFLGRIYLTRDKHISKNIILTSHGIELILMVLSGIIIFLFSLPFGINVSQIKKIIWLITLIPILSILLYPPVLQSIINISSKVFHFDNFNIGLNFLNIAEAILLFWAYWLFNGIAIFFLIRTLLFITPNLLPVIIGAFAISLVGGILSFLTPAGLGVREGVLSFLLSFYMPLSIAIFVSLLARICMVLTELTRAAVVVIVKRAMKKS